ncbi:MAG: signal peptidase I [Candidatus Omnitrophica bacterium]|nr:signal peptidase I [Candidatus Omnitrophota bacterium]
MEWKRRAWFDWRFITGESRRAYGLACILFWSVLSFFFCQRYVVSLGVMTERSMLPALVGGNYFLINKYIYHVARPKRGDIVVLRRDLSSSEEYVKRVIGLEGETLLIWFGNVYINGHRLTEPYAVGGTFPNLGPYTLPKDTYFVMGDNREESEDSRHFGAVTLREIEGKITPGELFPF